jgi:hypothetical protein
MSRSWLVSQCSNPGFWSVTCHMGRITRLWRCISTRSSQDIGTNIQGMEIRKCQDFVQHTFQQSLGLLSWLYQVSRLTMFFALLLSMLNNARFLVSQAQYNSRITGKDEKIPIVVSLMGAPATDLGLIQWTLEALRKSGRPTKVNPGKVAFE